MPPRWYHGIIGCGSCRWHCSFACGCPLCVSGVTSSASMIPRAPVVLLLWHDKLFVSSWIANRYFSRPVTALISTSKDGAWLVAFFRFMGIAAVRGSSNRRGAAALITLTRSMRAGHHTGITPDGPKGPALEFKTGGSVACSPDAQSLRCHGHPLPCLLAHAQLGSVRDADPVLESGSHLGARADACGRRSR
ncbi:uncharacterized protein RP090 [Opitutia bacterium]|nr:uncharacterized protein RP090 [Opitutae bacterium]